MGQPMANQTTTTTTTTGEHNGNIIRKNDPAPEDAGPFLVAHMMWPFLWPGYLRLFGHFLLRAVRPSEKELRAQARPADRDQRQCAMSHWHQKVDIARLEARAYPTRTSLAVDFSHKFPESRSSRGGPCDQRIRRPAPALPTYI